MTTSEKSIVSPILIGRSQELAELKRALHAALQGNGQARLIAGDAGVGKSRLLGEFSLVAIAQGVSLLQGRCFDQDVAFPYALWLDVIRTDLADKSPQEINASFGPFTTELVKLFPELSHTLSNLPPTPAFDPETERRRIFEALAYYVTNVAKTQPLLLILEDVHWSDKTSLDFLHFFIRRLSTLPILLLISYRHHEVSASLHHFLAQLDRERLSHEIHLYPLTRPDIEVMIGAILESTGPIHFNFLDAIYAFTEGNAFFVEEIMKLLIAAGEIQATGERWDLKSLKELHIPRSVADTVQQRTAHLTPAARRLLALAAVIGRRFDFTLLQALMEQPEHALFPLIKELVGSQLVVEESAERFAFRHALTREAVYTSLLRRERRQYHHQIIKWLEQFYASTQDRHLGALAYHAYEARLWHDALDYSQRAGEQAISLYAPREAIVHFTRAVEAARQIDQSPSAALLRARGKAYEIVGDFELARADFEETLKATQQNHDEVAEWQAVMDLGFLWSAHDYAKSGAYFQQALVFARMLNEQTMIAQSLNRIGNWCANVEQPTAALAYHLEALALFEGSDDRRGVAETYDLLGMTFQLSSDLLQAYRAYQKAIPLWRALEDRAGLLSSLASLPLCAASYLKDLDHPAISLTQAADSAAEAAQIGQEIGWRAGEAFAWLMLALSVSARGDYVRGLQAAQACLQCAEEIEHRQWIVAAHAALGMLYLDLLAFDSARTHLEQSLALAQAVGSNVWNAVSVSYLAATHVASGEVANVVTLLDEMLPPDTPTMQMQGQRLCWYARAEVRLAVGDAATALTIAERLIKSAANAAPQQVIPKLWRLHGKSLAAMGQLEAAATALQAAYNTAAEQGALPLQWRICIDLGQIYQGQSRRNEAAKHFMAARTLIQSLAPSIPEGKTRDLFLENSLAMLPAPSTPSPTQIAKQEFGGLTTREREVALLVAQGKSNQEISEALFVGVRTVEAHITRILNKLGFASRVQIATWVAERSHTLKHGR